MPDLRQRPARQPSDRDRQPWRVEGHPDQPPPDAPERPPTMPSAWRRFWWVLLALFALNFIVSLALSGKPARLSVPYTLFYHQVQQGNVREISSKGDEIQGTFRVAVRYPAGKGGRTKTKFQTVRPAFGDDGISKLLIAKNVTVNAHSVDTGTPLWQTIVFGFGPTLLARAVAGEADVPFFSISASEFIEAIVGVGASRVRDLFNQAKQAAPAIIFIDELDAIGRARGGGASFGGHDEREQTLNQILTEMDGFTGAEGVIVLGATNRPEILDPALLRPGRFDRRVFVNPPDRDGRRKILEVHTRSVPLADDVNLEQIAASAPGMVGADLRNLANEAALPAARRNHDRVTAADFSDALEKIVLGAARRITLSPQERERTAYHESGHALLGLLEPGADPVRKVAIIPRGQALGGTLQSPESDRYGYGADYLRGRIVGALGGRAAEELVYGDVTTGAESDLEQITNIARQMVGRWGMSDAVGLVSVLPRPGNE